MKSKNIPEAGTQESKGFDLIMGTEYLKEKSAVRKYGLWRISLRLKSERVAPESIMRVIYNLPAEFPAPSRVAREKDFLVYFETWGSMDVVVSVIFENKPPFNFRKTLRWSDNQGRQIPDWLDCRNDPESLRLLGRRLRSINAFKTARKRLEVSLAIVTQRESEFGFELKNSIIHDLVLCTYQDNSLKPDERLKQAFDLLKDHWPLDICEDPEILGMAGAIQKRIWKLTGRETALQIASRFYGKGFEFALRQFEKGIGSPAFTGINAAYVLDLQAKTEIRQSRKAGILPSTAWTLRKQAEQIRYEILNLLENGILLRSSPVSENKPDWWDWATLAEAHFGTGNYEQGKQYLLKGLVSCEIDEWEKESTFTQLADLIRMREEAEVLEKDWAAKDEEILEKVKGNLENHFPTDAKGKDPEKTRINRILRSEMAGKQGLALSGGGFRASLFHIGVLAKLAELGALRQMEVLSCVSGGSIIGARYYLEVRALLEGKTDEEITDRDYLEIVEKLQSEFLKAVQINIRTRVLADFRVHWRLAFSPHSYSWTEAIGKLYEREIFCKAASSGGERKKPKILWLNSLFIQPKGAATGGFSPGLHNWSREAKVPILVLNATALNTGHNWQFTQSFMGEPPDRIESVIDTNDRLRRMYYFEAPVKYKYFNLGRAVAASSCVPGIFDPIVLKELYPDGRAVTLVDGGVQDNQGTQGLLDQNCTALMISDASGQRTSVKTPSLTPFQVLTQADGVLQARLRLSQYLEVTYREKAALLKDKMFVHLRTGLQGKDVDWIDLAEKKKINQQKPARVTTDASSPHEDQRRDTGMARHLQEMVASLRTDLDSFTDAEAYALMYAGYKLTEMEFPKQFDGFHGNTGLHGHWDFLKIEPWMKGEAAAGAPTSWNFERRLELGKGKFFKLFRLKPMLGLLFGMILVAPFVALTGVAWRNKHRGLAFAARFFLFLALPILPILGLLFGRFPERLRRFGEGLLRVATGLFMATVGWIPFKLYLIFFHGKWIDLGKVPIAEEAAKKVSEAPIQKPSYAGT